MFKNAIVFQITDAAFLAALNLQSISGTLANKGFSPCTGLSLRSAGFVPVFGENSEEFSCQHEHNFLVKCKFEEKIIPNSFLFEKLKERVRLIEEQEERKLPAKERARLKEQLIAEIVPVALSRVSFVNAVIFRKEAVIAFDTTSPARAEEVLSMMRKAFGSLPVMALRSTVVPELLMSSWLSDGTPEKLEITDWCELKSSEEKPSVVKLSGIDLKSEAVHEHMKAGYLVSKLELVFDERISFRVDNKLKISKIRYSQDVLDEIEDQEAESNRERIAANFIVSSAELISAINFIKDQFSLS